MRVLPETGIAVQGPFTGTTRMKLGTLESMHPLASLTLYRRYRPKASGFQVVYRQRSLGLRKPRTSEVRHGEILAEKARNSRGLKALAG